MHELKPCPFCGSMTAPTVMNESEALFNIDADGEDMSMVVCCAAKKFGCGASTGFCDTAEQAVEAWNRRASGWIPCSEKKPKARTDVILQFDETMCVGFYSHGLWNVNTGNGFYTAVLPSEDQPIAWMPTPEPPKEVQHVD